MKATKFYLCHVIGEQSHSFGEMASDLCQIEAYLNSQLLARINSHSEDGIDVLMPSLAETCNLSQTRT